MKSKLVSDEEISLFLKAIGKDEKSWEKEVNESDENLKKLQKRLNRINTQQNRFQIQEFYKRNR